MIDGDLPPKVETPSIPSEFDIFNQVFVNSSLPDISTLHQANQLLLLTVQSYTVVLSLRTTRKSAGVLAAEKVIKERQAKNGKKKGKKMLDEAETDKDDDEEARDESESGAEDCIVVDVE
ncbi:hypothetical protein OIDMADRAFT_25999 [Oidiodendron maius Zn]|uniref:Uncharacterized protein n=1 Tax=Oidiodendron maius (strain Zn) TaxID=913774 RepID=A0A0C3DTP1_OIDMZ|nr:hypothetical protein OIDMADRAFT_25999 [Oidiodendron maius Zn]